MFSLSLTSLSYFFFVVVFLCIYYRIKKANQWIVLLLASGSFFVVVSGVNSVWWLLLSAVTTYGGARLLTKIENEKCRKAMICGVVVLVLGELFLLKYTKGLPFTAPIAISFYSLSILGYVLDVYWKISDAQKTTNYFSKTVFHSASLNPTRTKLSPTSNGRFTSIPSPARSFNISSSVMAGSLFLRSRDL